jgi:hypothetical protein
MRARLLLAGLAISAAAACAGVDDPAATLSVQFDSLPAPAVVYGDTLRDSTGAVRALAAKAYDGNGALLAAARFTYATLDTGIRVDTSGRVIATGWRTASARLIASSGGLQSRAVLLETTRRPDSLIAGTVDSILYSIGGTNTSIGASVKLRSRQLPVGATGDSVTKAWIVRYELVRAPTDATDGIADSVLVIGDNGKASLLDTTDASGTASRRVRIVPRVGATRSDSVILRAFASYRGVAVPGSPSTLIVRLQRAP